MPKTRILIVDDDHITRRSLSEFLSLEGHDVEVAECGADAIEKIEQNGYNVVLTDLSMPDVSGLEVLKRIKAQSPETIVVIITGYGTIESAVESIKLGAYHYVTKPIVDEEIAMVISRALEQQDLKHENIILRQKLDMRFRFDNLVGRDYKMQQIYDTIETIADTRATVLITGESGTGKTMIARAVHFNSSRRKKPIIEVSCGALPESLLESELFGHVKGSFTGAVSDKAGKFEAADGGTMFLDEISTASPALQVKLLRFLNDRVFERVGDTKTMSVDVRILLATNRDLETEVKEGRFREDLFYRINVISIHLPPLRERLGDIQLLAEHFLNVYAKQNNKSIVGFTDPAMHLLQQYPWPGNVRELENVIERAVVLARGRSLVPEDFPASIRNGKQNGSPQGILPLKKALETPERQLIEDALKRNNWHREKTAQALDINRTTLFLKMKKYGLLKEGEVA